MSRVCMGTWYRLVRREKFGVTRKDHLIKNTKENWKINYIVFLRICLFWLQTDNNQKASLSRYSWDTLPLTGSYPFIQHRMFSAESVCVWSTTRVAEVKIYNHTKVCVPACVLQAAAPRTANWESLASEGKPAPRGWGEQSTKRSPTPSPPSVQIYL